MIARNHISSPNQQNIRKLNDNYSFLTITVAEYRVRSYKIDSKLTTQSATQKSAILILVCM